MYIIYMCMLIYTYIYKNDDIYILRCIDMGYTALLFVQHLWLHS